jgi:IS5 family transposase
MYQYNYLAEDNRLHRLSNIGDPLEKVSGAIDFEMFRPLLDAVFQRESAGPGGRPPWDHVMMFKILLLQQWYGMADDRTEFQINDRLSFQRFLGLSLGDKVPDAKTIWLFRENLTKAGAVAGLFGLFERLMEDMGVITRRGSIVDATFVDAPRQRNTHEENKQIKEGKGGDLWSDDENKSRQKDKDARWTKKNDETHYGYKNHVKVDLDSKMVVDYEVTDASVHDSQEIAGLIDGDDKELWADSGYSGQPVEESCKEKNPDVVLHIIEKGYRNKPLTDEQIESNKEKSKPRVRVEHVFGHMTNSFGGIFVRGIGSARARAQIGLKNLAYNLRRYETLVRLKKIPLPCQG